MLLTFAAGLYEVYTLELKLNKEKKQVKELEDQMKTNVGLNA
jgi:hypothetical protein